MAEPIYDFIPHSDTTAPRLASWGESFADAAQEGCFTLVAFLVVYAIGSWFRVGFIAPNSHAAKKDFPMKRKCKVGQQVANSASFVAASAVTAPSRPHGASTESMSDGDQAFPQEGFSRASLIPVSAVQVDSPSSTPMARRSSNSFARTQSSRDARAGGKISGAATMPGRPARFPPDGNASAPPGRLAAARREALAALPGADGAEAHTGRQFLTSLRIRAARRNFQEGLASYDAAATRIDDACKCCANTWSLLLYCAVEAGEYRRCHRFYQQLCEASVPSTDDFVNMVKCCAARKDLNGLTELIASLREQRWQPDCFARNRALAACCSNRSIELAECILQKLGDVPMDIIAYNTVIKGHASVGNAQKCIELYETLLEGGLVPSVMTYGILLDACIGVKDLRRVKRIFEDLRASELEPNVVHYTAYIKCLVSSGLLTEAQDILGEMEANPAITPDLVTFSTLVKAFADRGHIADSMRVIERMVQQGVQPDSVVFNTLLTGCCVKPMATSQIMHIFSRLVEQGLTPSSATLSILVKAFAATEAWQVCLQTLETSLARFGLEPELWIFAQMAQACVRAGGGAEVPQAFVAMMRAAASRGEVIDKQLSNRMLRLCTCSGAGAQGSRLHRALMSAGGLLSPADVEGLASELAPAV